MMIRYWQPFREIETLRRQLDQVFDDLTASSDTPMNQVNWVPAIELSDAGDNLMLKAQLPGIDGKDLDIQVTRDSVSIAGEHHHDQQSQDRGYFRSEFSYGKFQRVISLPVQVENERVQADLKDGILTLTLPKVAEARNRVVKVNVAELASAESPALEAQATETGRANGS